MHKTFVSKKTSQFSIVSDLVHHSIFGVEVGTIWKNAGKGRKVKLLSVWFLCALLVDRKEAVTLPEKQETDVADIERSLNFSNATTTMGFQHTAYFAMRLDDLDEPYINNNPEEEDLAQRCHQADADNITLFERFDSYQANTDMYNHFERFDIEGDDEMQTNLTSGEHTQIRATLIPSPPPQDDPQRANEIQDQQPDFYLNIQSDECKPAKQDQHRHGPAKRKTRRPADSIMDYEQTMIPGHVYQSWLQNTSDIGSRRGRKRKARTTVMSIMKITHLMQLPPVVLIDDLFTKENGEIHYPAPLLELWLKVRTSPPVPPGPSSTALPERVHHHDQAGYPFEDFHSGVGAQLHGVPAEKLQTNLFINDISMEPNGEI